MVSRCPAHSFADGPCSVRDFPSRPVLSAMAPAPALALGVGVGDGEVDRPDQTGATARFSGLVMALVCLNSGPPEKRKGKWRWVDVCARQAQILIG